MADISTPSPKPQENKLLDPTSALNTVQTTLWTNQLNIGQIAE